MIFEFYTAIYFILTRVLTHKYEIKVPLISSTCNWVSSFVFKKRSLDFRAFSYYKLTSETVLIYCICVPSMPSDFSFVKLLVFKYYTLNPLSFHCLDLLTSFRYIHVISPLSNNSVSNCFRFVESNSDNSVLLASKIYNLVKFLMSRVYKLEHWAYIHFNWPSGSVLMDSIYVLPMFR